MLRCVLVGIVWVVLCFPAQVTAAWLSETFFDPDDGYLDVSNFLNTKAGFLPVPIIITEPSVGYGGGLALAFFHGQFTGTTVEDSKGRTRHVAPSVSALALAATENGTWFGGGGHFGIWRQDTIRYTGAAGYGSINMDYYGTGGELSGRPVEFNTEAFIFIQELQFRLWESPFFAGAGYTLMDTQNVFDTASLIPIPGLPAINFDLRSAGLNLMLNYDSRDNLFTPSSGLDAEIKVGLYGDTWGGDDDFTKYSAYAKYYHRLGDKWVLGLRGDARAVDGDAPFYEYPYISMRGVKVMRYQGEQTLLGEAEVRWAFMPRWALVGFGGAGKSYGSEADKDSDTIISKGVGFRYLIASKLGLQVGVDLAWGPEDTAIYIQVGNAWVKN